jgi:peptide/nickel transport system permease protein
VVLGVSIIVFLMIHLIPGDPARTMLGERASDAQVEALRDSMGLNDPLHVQYIEWVGGLLQGDLGTTLRGNLSVAEQFNNRFPATLELALTALTIAVFLGVPIGVISAVRRNSWIDTLSMTGALLGVSIPIFVLGLVLMYIFGVQLEWFNFVGRISATADLEKTTGLLLFDTAIAGRWDLFSEALNHLILPAITLMTIPLSIIARITRSTMLEVLNQDYIRTARAKGLREQVVIMRHALRNAMLPVLTIIGLQLGALMSGAVLTETIFSWPGIGKWLYDSILNREYPIVQSMTLVIALIYVGANLIVDVLYTVFDPRVRL